MGKFNIIEIREDIIFEGFISDVLLWLMQKFIGCSVGVFNSRFYGN